MKKILLLTLLFMSIPALTIPAGTELLYGVYSVNNFPVNYVEASNSPEGTVAIVGTGMFQGDCYHDGIPYAVIKGLATCPGYFEVFPKYKTSRVVGYTYIAPMTFRPKHINGSPACEESEIFFDPWN